MILLPICMRFPLILPYQTPCICRFERWYDNYHNEAYLTIMPDILEGKRRTSRRPVPWPWWPRLERTKGEGSSRELIMTSSYVFDLMGLLAQMCTQTHTSMVYKQEERRQKRTGEVTNNMKAWKSQYWWSSQESFSIDLLGEIEESDGRDSQYSISDKKLLSLEWVQNDQKTLRVMSAKTA